MKLFWCFLSLWFIALWQSIYLFLTSSFSYWFWFNSILFYRSEKLTWFLLFVVLSILKIVHPVQFHIFPSHSFGIIVLICIMHKCDAPESSSLSLILCAIDLIKIVCDAQHEPFSHGLCSSCCILFYVCMNGCMIIITFWGTIYRTVSIVTLCQLVQIIINSIFM